MKLIAAVLALLLVAPSAGQAADPQFHWRSTEPLIAPGATEFWAVKDPTVVTFNGRHHVFMTTAGPEGWHLAYTRFANWSEAPNAPLVSLKASGIGPGYRAAPQVFYFEPQGLWYMVFQVGPPMYSTTANIEDPMSWSEPKPFFDATPPIMRVATGQDAWLDFWVICDATDCYLFNTDDNGTLFRSRTPIGQFPEGFTDTAVAMAGARDDVFEASMHYRIAGTGQYLTVIEAISPQGRYFRSWTSDRLDGAWTPLADSVIDPFAGAANVAFDGAPWSEGVSHAELVREGYDQTLTIDPCRPLELLYQGLATHPAGTDYINLPYRLALLTATEPNPVSALCRTGR